MKKYFLYTCGCNVNKIDSKRIELLLKENGWFASDTLQGVDIIIFNTCAYNQGKEDSCISTIERFKKEKDKKTKLIVAGCLPLINKSRLLASFKGPYFGPLSLSSLCDIIGTKYNNIDKIPSAQAILTDNNTFSGKPGETFCIRIAYGCLNRCSFCAVKTVFPKLISKSRTDIVREFNLGLKKGYRNFSITGEDPTVYGLDIGTNLIELLTDLTKIKGKFTITLYRLNPEWLLKIGSDFIRILRSKKIKYLSITVNSGSDRIVRLMNRRYRVSEIKNYIKKLKRIFPLLKINLDFMVGFPGETEKDFKDTLKFVLETIPDSVRVFKFTDRPGTTAKYLGKEISPNVMEKRSTLLYQISEFAKQMQKRKS